MASPAASPAASGDSYYGPQSPQQDLGTILRVLQRLEQRLDSIDLRLESIEERLNSTVGGD